MNFFRKNQPLNQRSQIAVIITFVIAVIILFVVVFINITKVSQVKTTTSTAADRTALSLASQLGSMSHYYKDKVLKISGPCATPPCQVCNTDWVSLGVLIGVGLAIIGMAFFLAPAALIAGPLALVITASMLSGISAKYKEMTGYNAFRESALFQALRDIQSDDVEVKATAPGSGIFYDDTNNNGVFDATSSTSEPVYNLSTIPEMRNEKKVSRFAAWYYFLRLPLVGDEDMRNSLENIFLSRLKNFIDVDGWDSGKWKINKLSYVIRPDSSASTHHYDVTCSGSSCPDWVKDAATGQLRIVRMDASDNVSGGFLEDKFLSLLKRLKCAYPSLSFCSSLSPCATATVTCSDVDNLIEDLRMFLLRSKEVLNMPVSDRLDKLTQWFPLWYDFKKHDQTDINSNGDFREPMPTVPDDPNKYTYDIYLRLMRDQNFINAWIANLEGINAQVAGAIPLANGHNEYGLGCKVSECATVFCGGYCSGDGCCPTCINPQPCSFAGIYCSAYGDSTPPVCEHGDLYETHPSWCLPSGLPNKSPNCSLLCPSCNHQNNSPAACDFQGTLFYTTPPDCNNTGNTTTPSGPTEVDQTIIILRALNDDIVKIKMSIGDLADEVAVYLSKDDAKRNVIVYAWKNKPDAAGKQYAHLVQVKIDDYPKNLPNITESIEWGGIIPQKCRELNDYQGDLTITTWRYDQDQPTDMGWKLRRGKKESTTDEFIRLLNLIVTDSQDNAQIDTNQAMVDLISTEYAITSATTVHYGPAKSDIKIIKTEGD